MLTLEKDPLVLALDYGFRIEPMYFNAGLSDSAECWIRKGVAERLVEARAKLPRGLNFKIWDAYRTTATQTKLYLDLYKKIEQKNCTWSEDRLHEATREFVSPPTTDPLKAAPHNTGGTVDLTVVDVDGQELDMGTPFDHFDMESHTFHFKAAVLGTPEFKIHHNRMILHEAMLEVGFYNFPSEWWHYSYGDAHWAKHYGQAILYPSCEIQQN